MTEQDANVDFDFFETPRSPSKSDGSYSAAPDNTRSKKEEDRTTAVRRQQPRSTSPSQSSRSASPNYSSDSPVSDTESESKQRDGKKRNGLSRSSSGSSYSSRSRSRSGSRSDSSRSYSRSRSSSRSESGRGTKSRLSDFKTTGSKGSKVRRQQEEDDYSSSAYSDGDNGKSFDDEPTSSRKQGKRQAWGDNQNREGRSADKPQSASTRPMTAKTRSRPKKHTRSKSLSDSDSNTLSDSDITDVSPMESPRTHHEKTNMGRANASLAHVGAAGDGSAVKVQYRAMPVSHQDLTGDEGRDGDDVPSRGGLDLEILMEAVGELEKQKRVEANTRRVMFAPMTLKRNDKSNYTFDKDKTRDIERENQRLLQEIVRRVHSGEQRKQYRHVQPPVSKMTPSAVNREKDMKRIESENLSILRRLQKVKPTQTISRANQIRSYESTKLHGIPIAAVHPLPRTTKRTASRADDSLSSIGSRTRSMTSLHSVSSSVRSMGSRRSSRPSSATKRVDMRPEWNDRW